MIQQKRPLFAHVAVHNIASIRVLEKCGFEFFKKPVMDGDENNGELVFILKGN